MDLGSTRVSPGRQLSGPSWARAYSTTRALSVSEISRARLPMAKRTHRLFLGNDLEAMMFDAIDSVFLNGHYRSLLPHNRTPDVQIIARSPWLGIRTARVQVKFPQSHPHLVFLDSKVGCLPSLTITHLTEPLNVFSPQPKHRYASQEDPHCPSSSHPGTSFRMTDAVSTQVLTFWSGSQAC